MTASSRPPIPEASLAAILATQPLRAGGFIVTLYGDVVLPRGGEVWIGNVIESCAAVGISQTLVRTAVSRLVAAGKLVSRRSGRRGFYRLAPAAEAEFAAADRAIYGPHEPCGLRFTVLPEAGAEAAMAELERAGHARLRSQLAFGPDRGPPPAGALIFPTRAQGAIALLPVFAAAAFELQTHARAYTEFCRQFEPLRAAAAALDGPEALAARLILVHAYRATLLRDPRLPAEALPADWPGHAARTLFARLYLALSAAADSHVALTFSATSGLLAAETAATRTRLARLSSLGAAQETCAVQELAVEPLHE